MDIMFLDGNGLKMIFYPQFVYFGIGTLNYLFHLPSVPQLAVISVVQKSSKILHINNSFEKEKSVKYVGYVARVPLTRVNFTSDTLRRTSSSFEGEEVSFPMNKQLRMENVLFFLRPVSDKSFYMLSKLIFEVAVIEKVEMLIIISTQPKG